MDRLGAAALFGSSAGCIRGDEPCDCHRDPAASSLRHRPGHQPDGRFRRSRRVVHGVRAVPYEGLADFPTRLDGRQSSLELLPVMARMLAQGTGSDAATVWLNENGREIPGGSFPEHQYVPPGIATRCVPLQHSGASLGSLTVVRKSGEALSPTEERLMDGLASQAGLVLHKIGRAHV